MVMKETSARQTLNEASQDKRPSGVDLTPDGKQLPDTCDGIEELIFAPSRAIHELFRVAPH
jgi:hypothetical protein